MLGGHAVRGDGAEREIAEDGAGQERDGRSEVDHCGEVADEERHDDQRQQHERGEAPPEDRTARGRLRGAGLRAEDEEGPFEDAGGTVHDRQRGRQHGGHDRHQDHGSGPAAECLAIQVDQLGREQRSLRRERLARPVLRRADQRRPPERQGDRVHRPARWRKRGVSA